MSPLWKRHSNPATESKCCCSRLRFWTGSPRDTWPNAVEQLDLSKIYASYKGDGRGQLPYGPGMMSALLFYTYCTSVPSSRQIEKKTFEDVAFRVIAANRHPDHDSICGFRKRHFKALAALFVQVLRLCQQAGLVKLGHVALDGTKGRANAPKHKAMSYGRMKKKEEELEAEIKLCSYN
jgi:transposase